MSLRPNLISRTALVLAAGVLMNASGAGEVKAADTVDISRLQAELSLLRKENTSLKNLLSARDKAALTSAKSAGHGSVQVDIAKTGFSDIENLPTKKFISDLCKLHVFDGIGSEFKPYQRISRGEFVAWLVRAHNAVQKDPANLIRFAPQLPQQFMDLPPENPHYKYVQALANAGYSVGYDDHSFRPNQAITREEMLGIKVGVDLGKTIQPDMNMMTYVWKFGDSKQVDPKFSGYIFNDQGTGAPPYGCNIERAFGKIGNLKPKEAVLRNEAAAAIWAFGKFANISQSTAAWALQRAGNT